MTTLFRWSLAVAVTLATLPFHLATSPDDPLKQAADLLRERRYEEAERLTRQALESDPSDAQAHHLLGRIQLRLGEYDRAVEHLRLTVEQEPERAVFHLWLGRAYGEKARTAGFFGKVKWAMSWKGELERAFEIDTANLEVRSDLVQYLLNAPAIGGGDKKRAQRLAEEMVSLDEIRGRLLLASTYRATGELDAATREYERVLQLDPDNAVAHNLLGYQFLSKNEYDKAEQHFREYLNAAPGEPNPHDSMGDYYIASGSVDEAIEHYEAAIELDPRFSCSRYKLAQAFERKQMTNEAVRHYERLLELTPAHHRAKQAQKRLRALE